MTVHSCSECGLAHDEPNAPGKDPAVRIAEIEADRDKEVAKIAAGVSREEMQREIEALRAELTVRREEPPVAETEVTQLTAVEEQQEPAGLPPVPAGPAAEPALPEPAPPAEQEPPPQEPRSKGWFG